MADSSSNIIADGDDKTDVESKVEDDVKEVEKKQTVSELKKLQFYGAGPKTALPNVIDSDNGNLTTTITAAAAAAAAAIK